MLSFQVIREGRTIQICCDDQGVDALMAVLKKLRGSGSHVHLSAQSTGGENAILSDQDPFGEKTIVEVIITHGGD
jgi:glutamine synthetase